MPSRRLFIIWPRYLSSLGRPILDLSWITSNIAVSGSIPKNKHSKLRSEGICAVVDLREEDIDDAGSLATQGIEFHHIPVKNYHAPSQSALNQGSDWVISKLNNTPAHSKVLIHCQEGVGRSIVLTCCVLMKQGSSLQQSLMLIRNHRWGTALRKVQMQALIEFEATLQPNQYDNTQA